MTLMLFVLACGLTFVPHKTQGFALTGPCPARPALCLRMSAPPAIDAQSGQAIFNANCAACHAGGQIVMQAGKILTDSTLQKTTIEQYLMGGFNEKAVAYHITNGKNTIPVFAEKLSETEVALVAAYVIKSAADGWE